MRYFNNKKFLAIIIGAWFLLIFFISCWKYDRNLFNGFDLAIYNQTLYSIVHGHWMNISIHPGSYFGDHFEPVLFLLAPIYALIPHPLTLILIQTALLALTAWVIYLISKQRLPAPWPIVFASAWLANVFTIAAALYEFHALIFGICAIILAAYFYLNNKYWHWLLFIFLAIISREDMCLIAMAFALIAIIDKKHWHWWLPILLLPPAWYIGAIKIISLFSPDNHYKFFSYFRWLGLTPLEVIKTTITKPWLLLSKFLRPENLLLTIATLMPTLFVAIKKPKWLLLAVPPFLAFCLTESGGLGILFISHYGSALLPGLFLASVAGVEDNYFQLSPFLKKFFIFLFILTTVYCCLVMGFGKALYDWQKNKVINYAPSKLKNIALEQSVIASFGALTRYSSRDNAFSLHYWLTGHRQLSEGVFSIPLTDYLILDATDLLHFSAFTPVTYYWSRWWPEMPAKLRNEIKNYGLVYIDNKEIVFNKNVTNKEKLIIDRPLANNDKRDGLIKAEKINSQSLTNSNQKLFKLTINCHKPKSNNKAIKVSVIKANKKLVDYYLPYLWSFWRASECAKPTAYEQLVAIPINQGDEKIIFSLINASVANTINSLGIYTLYFDKIEELNRVEIK